VLVLISDDDETVPAGRNVSEPVYGAPARWIDRMFQEDAAVHGLAVVAPTEVVATHLLEVIKQNFGKIFSRRALPLILEASAEANGAVKNTEAITEYVRKRLGFQLVSDLQEPDGALPLIQLKPSWEELFCEYQINSEAGVADVALPPEEFNRLAGSVAERLSNAAKDGRFPALITSSKRRRFLQTVLRAKGIRNPVLSFDEIGPETNPALLGTA